MSITYKSAGVNLEAAEESTHAIAKLAKSTFNDNVLKNIGLFSGFYSLDKQNYKEPVIVSSIDGVGTKLKVAFMMDIHHTVGQDLVNHCVNDIMTSGADPLFFLDYIGTQSLEPKVSAGIVEGMATACKQNNCALIGGETAEMPGFYTAGEYDLAGTIVGIVEKSKIIDGTHIEEGDILIGLPSNGLHTNGYSLARKVLFDHANVPLKDYNDTLGASWGETLLKVHKSYRKPIQAVRDLDGLVGISHITGGGIVGNTNRLLREGLKLDIDWQSWTIPQVFQLIQKHGDISDDEMRKSFNLGIGLIFIVKEYAADIILKKLTENNEKPLKMGRITKDSRNELK